LSGIADAYNPVLERVGSIGKWETSFMEKDPEAEERLRRMTIASFAFLIGMPLVMGALIVMR